MTSLAEALLVNDAKARRQRIVDTLTGAFADLMASDPVSFRTKFRKMAADPFAFYRGSACLFYADVAEMDDPWADERARRVWIQGDLHAENFGTYLNDRGVLVFDVNDFDEAYLGHFTWDLQRFAASMALLGWSKALSDSDIDTLIRTYLRTYLDQVRQFLDADDDSDFSLRLGTAHGAVEQVLRSTRLRTRVELLDKITETSGYDRVFRDAPGVRRLDDGERTQVRAATSSTPGTAPPSRSAPCRRTPTRCWATPSWTVSVTWSVRSRLTRPTWTGVSSPSPPTSSRWSTSWGAPPPRCTAYPIRIPTTRSSRSRPRRPSRP